MSFIAKAIAWMSDHKLLTFLGAAGVGALVVPKVAQAAKPLPGAPGVQKLPGGGLVSPTKVVEPPNVSDTPLQILYVTTRDPAPEGNLNARASSDVQGGVPIGVKIGYWPKDGAVELLDPGPGNGMVFVRGPGIGSTGENVQLKGWAWSGYLKSRAS